MRVHVCSRAYLEYPSLHHKQLYESTCVFEGGLHHLQRLLRLIALVVMLSQEEVRPQERRRRLLLTVYI